MISFYAAYLAQAASEKSDGLTDETGKVDVDPKALVERVDGMVDGTIKLLPNIAIAIVVFVLILIAGKIAQKLIRKGFKEGSHANIGQVMGRLIKWAAILAGLLVATSIIVPSVGAAELLSSLGIGGVAIGFAFKDILQNLLAGILILIRQPFKVGDIIEFDGYYGVVEEIETRCTIMKTLDGKQILIPNGQIYTNPVTVHTAHDQLRSEYDIGIGYADDIAHASEKIIAAMASVEGVSEKPEPEVLVVDLGDSTINLRARWWTGSGKGVPIRTESKVLKAVKDTLDAEGIDMPYPTQIMLFHDQTEETDGDRTKQREGWPAGQNPPKPARLVDRSSQKNG